MRSQLCLTTLTIEQSLIEYSCTEDPCHCPEIQRHSRSTEESIHQILVKMGGVSALHPPLLGNSLTHPSVGPQSQEVMASGAHEQPTASVGGGKEGSGRAKKNRPDEEGKGGGTSDPGASGDARGSGRQEADRSCELDV